MAKNAFYAQSGGPTSVINATACGLIETAAKYSDQIGKVFAGHNGIVGALTEELIDLSQESSEEIALLKHTPASAFGSCRYRLKDLDDDDSEYRRLIEVFKAHDIGYFFYNGGGDSQDTSNKVAQMSHRMGYPLTCIGLPKTIDNDLAHTDCCPGFGSVAKYVATSIQEAALDVKSMCATSTKVFILEVMGRHAGWIAASGGLGQQTPNDPPHIILFPEVPFAQQEFLNKVEHTVNHEGYCVIVVSEGIKHTDGSYLTDSGLMKDAFGHSQLGGVAPILAHLIKRHLGYKYHWAVADYLQRAAAHIASKTDVDQAYALGAAAIEKALAGDSDVMLTIVRESEVPYSWRIGTTPLSGVANFEAKLPEHYIASDGMHISDVCREHLMPLIQGEAMPPFVNGLPRFAKLKKIRVEKKLPAFKTA